ncbi:MAG TPA: SRPBCC family protein [Nakamurella sp.]|nr:SRPBCC family protein [Nakamurella sp.]
MELEHRFEVPVGIDRAWESLLNMELVASCFPGATLTSADGEEYTGSVRVKLGPIQLTYKGSARIVERDEAAHQATIEASGNASRSSSTATMLVKAKATEISADRTAVRMDTNLTITGRPAQFGRGVMAEVGNKIIGQFADCLSSKLSGDGDGSGEAAGAGAAAATGAAADAAGSAGDAAGSAGADATRSSGAGETPAASAGSSGGPSAAPSTATSAAADTTGAPVSVAAAGTTTGGAGGRPDAGGQADGPRHSAGYTRSPEPIDLLESAGAPVLKRLLPVVGGLLALWLLRRVFRGSKSKRLARKASRRAGKALDLAKQAIEQDESSGE